MPAVLWRKKKSLGNIEGGKAVSVFLQRKKAVVYTQYKDGQKKEREVNKIYGGDNPGVYTVHGENRKRRRKGAQRHIMIDRPESKPGDGEKATAT